MRLIERLKFCIPRSLAVYLHNLKAKNNPYLQHLEVGEVNLMWAQGTRDNLGDFLSTVIYDWMLERGGVDRVGGGVSFTQ